MSDVALDILMITWNRPRYTALTLQRLLDTCDRGMRVWVWQNGQDSETLDVLASFREHPRLHHVHVNPENKGLREPTNWFWRHADAPYVSKVDDDCLVPDRWAETLIAAHAATPELGLIGCWRFYDQDFVPELADRKLRDLPGGHRMMLNCWVQGSGYVMKKEVVEQLGPLAPHESFTDYGVRAVQGGWINGWYFPFIHEEHMDDPRSPYSQLRSEEDFRRNRPLSAVNDNVQSLEEWKNRVRWMARAVQAAPYEPLRYVGWRARMRQGVTRMKRLAGWTEPWRVSR